MVHAKALRSVRTAGFGGIILLLAGCGGEERRDNPPVGDDRIADAAPHDWRVVPGVRVGPVYANTAEADLLALVGTERLAQREVYLAEGFCTDGSVLYPDSPDAVDIAWADSARTRPAFVRLRGTDSRWATPAGVRIGTTLAELEAIRGDVLVFSGFGWDYGGGLAWHETSEIRTAGLQIGPDNASSEAAMSDARWGEILGDRPVRSDHPLVRRLTIRVETMGIGFDAPFNEHDCRTLSP